MSRNMCKLRHKLRNAKTGVGPTFTWSNEAWFTQVNDNVTGQCAWRQPPSLSVLIGWVIHLTKVKIQSYPNCETNVLPIQTKSNNMEILLKCTIHIFHFKTTHFQGLPPVFVIYMSQWCLKLTLTIKQARLGFKT